MSCGGQPCNKRYWNVAFGFKETTPNCTLTTSMTASAGTLSDFKTPTATTYPYIDVNVPLTNGTTFTCHKHALDGTNGVGTTYTAVSQRKDFSSSYAGGAFAKAVPSVVTSGLLLHLDAGDSSSYSGTGAVWSDLSGLGNHGTLNGPTFQSAAPQSFDFDGTNDLVSLALQPIPSAAFTLSAFVRGDSFSNTGRFRRIFVIDATGSSENPFCLFVHSNGKVGYVFNNGSTATDSLVPIGDSPVLATSTWYQVTFTFDGSAKRLYVNGTLAATINNAATFSNPRNENMLIGTYGIHAEGGYWDGQISNALLYGRALSSAEVTQNFNALKSRFGF